MHTLEHSSIHVRAAVYEAVTRTQDALRSGSACIKPPCKGRGTKGPRSLRKPREVAGLRGTIQLVSSHTLTFEIAFGGQLQTARDRRSTGLQRTFSIL
jgi:hypothetical protein